MKILVDNKIPYIHDAIQFISDDVYYLAAEDFTNESVKNADVLIIRTRTKCNKELLEGSKVKFIATATIGFDHIDIDYCKEKGIAWKNAPGCNANSVKQYIQSTLILLKRTFFGTLNHLTIGVIGVGHVGSKIVEIAENSGMTVLMNDPLRAKQEVDFQNHDLKEIAQRADIISFHVPLVKDGLYPTYHLADASFFSSLSKKPIIINTSRGEVIDTSSIKNALSHNKIRQAVIDVWENEPYIDVELLENVFIGTPHIAGYSADGKAKASQMALESVCEYFNIDRFIDINPPTPLKTEILASDKESALLDIYNPMKDSFHLKEDVSSFEYLRSHYALRREPLAFDIIIQ